MKIASVTIYCNEQFRLSYWIQFFNEYRHHIYLQVIVNNGSVSDTDLLKESFPEAVVLESPTNNMIASYNMGVQYILNNTDADSILQITNDIRLEGGGLKALHELLYGQENAGLISPILLKKDSDIIESYGAEINLRNLDFIHIAAGKRLCEIPKSVEKRNGLPGGCFLTKRNVYEQIGLQDIRINMYADEIDTGIKCAKQGIELYATSLVLSWHQHVYPGGKILRNPMAYYFMARNPIYIAKKHYGFVASLRVFRRRLGLATIQLLSCIHHLKSREYFKCAFYSFRGCLVGLFY